MRLYDEDLSSTHWAGRVLHVEGYGGRGDGAILQEWLRLGRPGVIVEGADATPKFLPKLEGLTRLYASGVIEGDDRVVSECIALEFLGIATDCTSTLDLRPLKQLKELELGNARKGSDVLPSALEALSYWGCPWRDLEPLRGTPRLQALNISGRRVRDLQALSECTLLSRVRLNYIKVADPFVGVELASLERIAIEASRAIRSLKHVSSSAPSLQFLELVDIPHLESLAPLSQLTSLRLLSLTGSTRVLDGDLRPLGKIPCLRARIRPMKNYFPSVKELALEPKCGEFDFSIFGDRL